MERILVVGSAFFHLPSESGRDSEVLSSGCDSACCDRSYAIAPMALPPFGRGVLEDGGTNDKKEKPIESGDLGHTTPDGKHAIMVARVAYNKLQK